MTPELYHILLKNVILFSRPVPITGSKVPDSVYLCVREQRNISTIRGSTAYLDLPNVKCVSMCVATQVRHSFQNARTSPFSDVTNGVTSRTTLGRNRPR